MKASNTLRTMVGAGLVAIVTTCCAKYIPPNKPPAPKAATVLWSPLARNDIQFNYDLITAPTAHGFEFARCLHGFQKGDITVVNYTRPPYHHYATTDSVSFSCQDAPDYLGPAHSHPQRNYDTCKPSIADYLSFLSNKRNTMMAIFCNRDKYLSILRPENEDSVIRYLRTRQHREGVEVVDEP